MIPKNIGQRGQAFEPFNPTCSYRGHLRPGGSGDLRSAFLHLDSDEKGQAFEPFKMLIGAIMALAVLLIIIGAIQYFENLRLDVSKQRFLEGLQNAVRMPNGELLVVDELQFQKGQAYTAAGLAKNAGLEGECITFTDNGENSIEVDEKSVEFTQGQQVDAYIKCEPNTTGTCEIGCEISFNTPI